VLADEVDATWKQMRARGAREAVRKAERQGAPIGREAARSRACGVRRRRAAVRQQAQQVATVMATEAAAGGRERACALRAHQASARTGPAAPRTWR
jgi:hypothetical protein